MRNKRASLRRRNGKSDRDGRPSKYSRSVMARISRFVRQGLTREAAASLSGIAVSTLYDWQRKFPEFYDAVKKAEAQLQASLVQHIEKASRKNWTAAAWLLERRFPEEWGRTHRHLIKTSREKPEPKLPDAYIIAIAQALGEAEFEPLGTRSGEENAARSFDSPMRR